MSSGGSSSKGRKIVLKGLFNKNLSIPKPNNNKEFQNNVSDSVVAFAELPQGQIESLNIGNLDDDRLRIMGRSIQANDIDDPQLGAVERMKVCYFCHQSEKQCTGHIGYIELPRNDLDRERDAPIYQYPHIVLIRNILASLCPRCAKLVLSEDEIKKIQASNRYDRIKMIAEASAGHACSDKTCKIAKPLTYQKSDPSDVYIRYETPDGPRTHYISMETDMGTWTLESVVRILNRLSPEDISLLGFGPDESPRKLIRYLIPVVPPCARPSNFVSGTMKPHALKEQYKSLLTKIEIFEKSPASELQTAYQRMAQAAYEIITVPEKAKNSNQNILKQGISEILKGKQGFLRSSVVGRRTEFSARAVITPAPDTPFGTVRIPSSWKRQLPVGVLVEPGNLHEINQWKIDGKIVYISQSRFTQAQGKHKIIMETDVIEPDMVVYRELEEGDVVFFNRHPTISKYGILGAEVLFWDEKTVGLHLAYMKTIAGDFDGDEVSVHVIQNARAIDEVRDNMLITKCLVSAADSGPVFKFNQDVVGGGYYLSRKEGVTEEFELDSDTFDNFVEATDIKGRLPDGDLPKYSPKRLLSAFIPDDLTYTTPDFIIEDGIFRRGFITLENIYKISEKIDPPNEFIKRGIGILNISTVGQEFMSDALYDLLLSQIKSPHDHKRMEYKFRKYDIPKNSGRRLVSYVFPDDFSYSKDNVKIEDGVLLEGSITGSALSGITKKIVNLYDEKTVTKFYDDVTAIFEKAFRESGASISLGDCLPTDIDEHKNIVMKEVNKIIRDVTRLGGKIDDPFYEEKRLKQIDGIIREGTNTIINKVKPLIKDKNFFLTEIESGAKGSIGNLNSIVSLVGQVYIEDGLPQKKMIGNRTSFYGVPETDENDDIILMGLDPRERLFCTNNYACGLAPREVFAVFQAARESNAANARSTPKVGSVRRNIAALIINLIIKNGLLMNGDEIVSFAYGGDMMDPGKMVRVGDEYAFANPVDEFELITNQVMNDRTRIVLISQPDPNLMEANVEELELEKFDIMYHSQLIYNDYVYDIWMSEFLVNLESVDVPNFHPSVSIDQLDDVVTLEYIESLF